MSILGMWGILICGGAAAVFFGGLLYGLLVAAGDGRDITDEGRAFGGESHD